MTGDTVSRTRRQQHHLAVPTVSALRTLPHALSLSASVQHEEVTSVPSSSPRRSTSAERASGPATTSASADVFSFNLPTPFLIFSHLQNP